MEIAWEKLIGWIIAFVVVILVLVFLVANFKVGNGGTIDSFLGIFGTSDQVIGQVN